MTVPVVLEKPKGWKRVMDDRYGLRIWRSRSTCCRVRLSVWMDWMLVMQIFREMMIFIKLLASSSAVHVRMRINRSTLIGSPWVDKLIMQFYLRSEVIWDISIFETICNYFWEKNCLTMVGFTTLHLRSIEVYVARSLY